jgi:uncharacterized protein (TIGR03083 family)
MGLWDLPVLDVRPHLRQERQELLALLSDLPGPAWDRATPCPGWTVKDLANHILDDDFGWLSRGRDGDRSGSITAPSGSREFVAALNDKNQRWVVAARQFSPRLIVELLRLAGRLMDDWWAGLDLTAAGHVSWASDTAVPLWFDVAQDLTERWVHQQQIRRAVGVPGLDDDRFLGTVLRTFVWALPHHFRVVARSGASVGLRITGVGGGEWVLRSVDGRWDLSTGTADGCDATVEMPAEAAWRMFVGGLDDRSAVQCGGDPALASHVLQARAILI